MLLGLHVKYPLLFTDFNQNSKVSTTNFIKITSTALNSLHANRPTDMVKLISSLLQVFVLNMPKTKNRPYNGVKVGMPFLGINKNGM
jgi:hypothetical protein